MRFHIAHAHGSPSRTVVIAADRDEDCQQAYEPAVRELFVHLRDRVPDLITKFAFIRPALNPLFDLEYRFAQVVPLPGSREVVVDWSGNCGHAAAFGAQWLKGYQSAHRQSAHRVGSVQKIPKRPPGRTSCQATWKARRRRPRGASAGPTARRSWPSSKQGLTAQRIFQDLRDEQGFSGKYHSVRRYVRRLSEHSELAFRRIEVEPGHEMQVDYGTGARCQDQEGKLCKTHVFRLVLSHSRKGYSEAVRRLTTESFIRSLENAFWTLGGVPKVVVFDNAKAVVSQADWYDPGAESQDRGVLPALPLHAAAHAAAHAAPQGEGGARRGLCAVQCAARPRASPRWPSRTSTCGSGSGRSPTRGFTAPRRSTWANRRARKLGLAETSCELAISSTR